MRASKLYVNVSHAWFLNDSPPAKQRCTVKRAEMMVFPMPPEESIAKMLAPQRASPGRIR